MRFGARRAVAALSVLGLCGCAMHDTVGHAQPAGPVAVFSDDFTGPAGTPPGGPWRPSLGRMGRLGRGLVKRRGNRKEKHRIRAHQGPANYTTIN